LLFSRLRSQSNANENSERHEKRPYPNNGFVAGHFVPPQTAENDFPGKGPRSIVSLTH
jgi:hypothetical protein